MGEESEWDKKPSMSVSAKTARVDSAPKNGGGRQNHEDVRGVTAWETKSGPMHEAQSRFWEDQTNVLFEAESLISFAASYIRMHGIWRTLP